MPPPGRIRSVPTTTQLPEDLQCVADDLDANLRRAEAVAGELDDRRINWQPSATSWSIAQCLDHLNVADRIYLGLMRKAAEEARRKGRSRRGPLRQGFVERWFTQSLEPPPRRRFPAPRQIVPASRRGKEEVLAEFRRLHADAGSLLREAADLDLGIRFPNPFLPLVGVTVGSGFLIITTHERRHLWQAEQVRQRPEFPSANILERS